MLIARDVVINLVRHCWSLIELPGWRQQPHARPLRSGDSGVTSSRLSGTASPLPRFKDLDGLDIRFLAPAAGLAFGQLTASRPLGVAEGRDALGPELAWRVRGEVDHRAMAVEAAHASALVQLSVLVDSLELDAHAAPLKDCRGVGRSRAAPRCMAELASELGGGELTYEWS